MTQDASRYAAAPELYYRNTGRIPISRFISALGSIAIVAILLGAIYGFISAYVIELRYDKLIIIAAIVLVMGFGFGLGGASTWLLKWADVRNLSVVQLFAVGSPGTELEFAL